MTTCAAALFSEIPSYERILSILVVATSCRSVLTPGSRLSGSFNLQWGVAAAVPVQYDASDTAVQAALQGMGTGAVNVVRSGPDLFQAYSWRVSFIAQAGDVTGIVATYGALLGASAKALVLETAKGTVREVRTISTASSSLSPGTPVSASTRFRLQYGVQQTGPIQANAAGGCSPTQLEVQSISTTTVDTTATGGDFIVSPALTFQLIFSDRVTATTFTTSSIPAGGNCAASAANMTSALQALSAVQGPVTVTPSATVPQGVCTWSITFTGMSGNQALLQVVSGAHGPGSPITVGDDTITVTGVTDGAVNGIKYELELLPGVGTVTVTPTVISAPLGTCSWRVTFDTATGTLPTWMIADYTVAAYAIQSHFSHQCSQRRHYYQRDHSHDGTQSHRPVCSEL